MVTNIKLNYCRLFHSGISISKKERRRKLFGFNLVTIVYICICIYILYVSKYIYIYGARSFAIKLTFAIKLVTIKDIHAIKSFAISNIFNKHSIAITTQRSNQVVISNICNQDSVAIKYTYLQSDTFTIKNKNNCNLQLQSKFKLQGKILKVNTKTVGNSNPMQNNST